MSDVLTTVDVKRALKPASRWRNWYRARMHGVINSRYVCPGDIACGLGVWPSKEIAEQKSWEGLPKRGALAFDLVNEYLGAYPEGERP